MDSGAGMALDEQRANALSGKEYRGRQTDRAAADDRLGRLAASRLRWRARSGRSCFNPFKRLDDLDIPPQAARRPGVDCRVAEISAF